MAVIGTFGQFTTARLAIYASQASLSVTGNNIANINTEGYTRQRMDLVSLYSTGQGKYANIFNTNVGYGVLTRGATQLRDPYLDIRYRNETSKLNANSEKADGLHQISSILDEVGKGTDDLEGFGVIEAQFGEFFDALNAGLDVNIGSEEYDKLLRSASETLTSYFRKASSDLQDIKVNKANELIESVGDINKLLTQIRDLNVQIRTQGIYGEKALELRDARNLALDKLSEYIPIDVTYSMEQIDQFTEVEKLTVTIKDSRGPDGQAIKLVDGIYGGQLTIPGQMPVLNPNADQKKITDAMQKAREDAMGMVEADVIKRANDEAAADPTKKTWGDVYTPEKVKTAQDREVQRLLEKLNVNPKDFDPTKLTDGDPTATPPVDASKPSKSEYEAALAKGEQKAKESALNYFREQFAEADAQKAQAEESQLYGKYLTGKAGATPDGTAIANVATDNWDEAETYFNFDEKNIIDDNSLYLMRVEQLVDQRGRVMEDKNEPSGKSEIVALTDTTFCAKSADASISDLSRIDSNALGSIQAMREILIRKGEYSSPSDIARDDYATIKRGIPYYERALDNLAKKFADEFNKMNQLPAETVYQLNGGNAYLTDVNSTNYTFLDTAGVPLKKADGTDITLDDLTEIVYEKDPDGNPTTTPMTDADGNIVREQKTDANAQACLEILREKAAKNPGYSYYNGGVLFSTRGDNNNPEGITAANISVSKAWSSHTVRVLATKQKFDVDGAGNETDHSTIRDNIAHMITEFDKKRDYYATEVKPDAAAVLPVFHGTFREVFTALSGILADDTQETQGKVENYTISSLSLENDRQSVSGVDLNDEATSMMQFSKSYAAACRLLTTIDSMLDTLINGTAR